MHEFNYAIVLRIILYPRYQQKISPIGVYVGDNHQSASATM